MEYVEFELPMCYKILFRTVSDAIDAMELEDFEKAKQILIQGELDAEDALLDEAEEAEEVWGRKIGKIKKHRIL